MTKSLNPSVSAPAGDTSVKPMVKGLVAFAVGLVATSLVCLGAYAWTIDRMVARSSVPATYKWFLLKEVPGPRIIFESGSNSHHAINTDAVGIALGRTAINIADNGGYALEDKLTRLEQFTRPGDVVVLPLEWTYYHRDTLTDDYVSSLFGNNADYYRSMPVTKRVARALSIPPATYVSQTLNRDSGPIHQPESPAQDLFVSALTQPTGHASRPTSSGPGAGVADQSCDDYVLGKPSVRRSLSVGQSIESALTRLKRLQAQGIDIHFAWPVLTGDACLTDPAYMDGFRTQIEDAVEGAGFEFLGTPSQSVYAQAYQDDSPYHVIRDATDMHTQQMIGFLTAQGYATQGSPLDITNFARHRLLELELAGIEDLDQLPLTFNEVVRMDDPDMRDRVHFTAGWWAFEPYGRWMRDNLAVFRITLPENSPDNAVLVMSGITKSGQPEMVHVSVNGRLIASGLFGEGAPLSVPVSDLPTNEALSVFVDLPSAGEPQSPKDLGDGEDARSMTLHLQSLELKVEMSEAVQAVSEGAVATDFPVSLESVAINDATEAAPISGICKSPATTANPTLAEIQFGDGWWAAESEGRWMIGAEARFAVEASESAMTPHTGADMLKLNGNFFTETPPYIDATINGRTRRVQVTTHDNKILVPLETSDRSGHLDVTLAFPLRELQSPKALGLSSDDRTLTYFLKSVELTAG